MATNVRLIPRLDIKAPHLIKGVHLEGLRRIGDPREHAQRYYEQGADEIIYMDVVASLYERNGLADLVRYTAENVFVPLTVGGGIRSLDDVERMLRNGADKVAINTAATREPEIIGAVARRFGAQCMVLSVEAKQTAPGRWEAYSDNGRNHTGLDVLDWVRRGAESGCGEILLTSVDREGTRKGFDVALCRAVSDAVTVPVIASGGMGAVAHIAEAVADGHADAVAIADALHHRRMSLPDIRRQARELGVALRQP